MQKNLSQRQRLLVAAIYFVFITVLFTLLGGTPSSFINSNSIASLWFCSGALLIILGVYITEPFFTRPADTVTNCISLLLALISIKSKEELIGYRAIFTFAVVMLLLSILTIVLKDSEAKAARLVYLFVMTFGKAKIVFSSLYIFSAYSYFTKYRSIELFVLIMTLWLCLCFCDPVAWLMQKYSQVKRYMQNTPMVIGIATRCADTSVFILESPHDVRLKNSLGSLVIIKRPNAGYWLGLITNCTSILEYMTLEVACLEENGEMIILDEAAILNGVERNVRSVMPFQTQMIRKDLIPAETLEKIESNELYTDLANYIGRILPNSDIATIQFLYRERAAYPVYEGAIIYVYINGQKTLYQIMNGITRSETVALHNQTGYVCAFARKLGSYQNGELHTVKWVPNTSAPVFLLSGHAPKQERIHEMAQTTIGRLPNTDMGIPIADINSLVTHNTAILGILGIGKSCLCFELIKKIVESEIKIICIDATNQYVSDSGLLQYLDEEKIAVDLPDEDITLLRNSYKDSGSDNQPSAWGNMSKYRTCLASAIDSFINGKRNVFIINPDRHYVGKAASQFRISETTELTIAEKTRIISEETLRILMKFGQSSVARCLIVYEEAHSLIPEWNSVANDGDKTAVNGTAKVILQGRKYGLGCLVITQRTANISKSILNQCNTIFALRVFDDTGKAFLENYIGTDYSSILPTLEERHAIVVGKGLALKQPVILQLNDSSDVIKS